MGRRKIEIQPITHERNRSVTFLKRKNGLFKKAYELGVLCSVDVAVIIFEERPGHHLKLYQYCSTDVHEIVQRHLRHDGEKDTRGPQDFSGNANTKLDDGADGEDDDVDEDDDAGKRRSDPKLKRSTDLTMSTDLDFMSHQRGLSIPQPPLPMHGLAQGSSLPISNDRHGLRSHPPSSHPSKRPRTDHPSIHSRSPSDDHIPSGSAAYHYQSGSAGTFARTGGQYHHSGGSQYTPLYPVSTHTPPPPGFIPLQQDFSSSRGPPPRSATGPPPPPFSAARSNSSGSSYDANMYNNMMRPPSGSHHPSGGGNVLFSAFLDADEHSRQSQGQGFGLDWPVHGSNPNSGPPGPNAAAPVPNPSTGASGAEGGNNWLDFLSGNANAASSGRDPSMSWERSGGDNRADMVDMFASGTGSGGGAGGGGGSGVQTASPLGVGIGGMAGKRGRVGSEVEDTNALGGSPGSVNGIGNDKKDMKAEGGG